MLRTCVCSASCPDPWELMALLRGASLTWLDLHTQLVERVLLSGGVHVLPEERSARSGFQTGVGSAWKTKSFLKISNHLRETVV